MDELEAIGKIVEALNALGEDGRKRALDYVTSRFRPAPAQRAPKVRKVA